MTYTLTTANVKKRILIIDNEKDLLELLIIFFRGEGFTVYGLYDEDKIFEIAKEFKPDIVLLDVRLDKNDGRKICTELQKLYGFPVVLFSADSSAKDFKNCKASAFVSKPFDLDELLETIKKITSSLEMQDL